MHDHMFNPNSLCEEVCAGNRVDLVDSAALECTSLPPVPERTSLPSAPERTSLPPVPERTSLPSAPERTSAPVTGVDRTCSGVDRTSSPVTGADRTSSPVTGADRTSSGADRTSSPSASGSSVLEEAALPAVVMNAPEISRPMTRLQADTRKPKVYTDDTI
jgi:hypothetical protein